MRDVSNADLEFRICNKIAFWSFILISFVASHTALKVCALLAAIVSFACGEFVRYKQDESRKEK
jgi:hypothetical protein